MLALRTFKWLWILEQRLTGEKALQPLHPGGENYPSEGSDAYHHAKFT